AGMGACCFGDGSCRFLTEAECEHQGGIFVYQGTPCDPNPCPHGGTGCSFALSYEERIALRRQVLQAQASSPVRHQTETGRGSGSVLGDAATSNCGTLFFNADGTYENGYAWQYQGNERPYWGAFAEGYAVDGLHACSIVLDLTQIGNDTGQTMDLYVWDDAGGAPGPVLGLATGANPGPIAFWPSLSRHSFSISSECANSTTYVGYWGNWPGQLSAWYVGADLDGFGGCPLTNIAPGIGYPTGWNNVSIVWGPTQAIGIGAEFVECGGTPILRSSWGRVKALFR
ncbi:MAG: hypothetical protein R3E97_16625, partial [Candidatus Eisenbacteria bacterium]